MPSLLVPESWSSCTIPSDGYLPRISYFIRFFLKISKVTFSAVVARLKTALSLKKDKDVAEALGMNANAFYNRKRLSSVPYEEIVAIAERNRLRMDWLLFGSGD